MQFIYVNQGNIFKYFIHRVSNDSLNISGNYTVISKEAFSYSSIKDIIVKAPVSCIQESAFKECGDIESVIFTGTTGNSEIVSEDSLDQSLKSSIMKIDSEDTFTIQKDAFKNCTKLVTVMLPETKKIVIEKDAFYSCESLRTVVAVADACEFSGNPFENCSQNITFICRENSEVAKFVREYGYKSVYVK